MYTDTVLHYDVLLASMDFLSSIVTLVTLWLRQQWICSRMIYVPFYKMAIIYYCLLFFCCVAATKNFFAGVAAAGAKTLKITVHETGALNTDMTYERAEFEFLQEDGTTFKHGKWVLIDIAISVASVVCTYVKNYWPRTPSYSPHREIQANTFQNGGGARAGNEATRCTNFTWELQAVWDWY